MDRRDVLRSGLAMAASGLMADGMGSARAAEASGDSGPGAGNHLRPPADNDPRPSGNEAAAKALQQLIDAEWDYKMQQSPTTASQLGDRRWNDRWDDLSLDAIHRNHQHELEVVDRLKSIDRTKLSTHEQLNYDLFRKEYDTDLEEYPFGWYLIPLNQRDGVQTWDQLADALPFDTLKDYEEWLERLRSYPVCLEQTTGVMREGIRQKMLLPRVVMQRLPAQLDQQMVRDPAASSFYKPFRKFPASIAKSDQERLGAVAREAIASGIVPAFARFKTFFVDEYLPACFDQVGIWQVPNGEALYAFFVRKFTTTNLTPDEVYQIGVKEVERIHGEMERVRAATAFQGSREAFFKYLRTDPRFFEKTPEELLKTYRATAKRIDPQLVKLFRVLPRQPYGVEPIPAAIAPDTTTAYYMPGAGDGSRAGIYYVNLYKPETRPTWEMMALTLHESVPGHHVQIALAMEQTDLPDFRRYGYYNAFGEGWGLYAESLGEEMGLYDDPYSKFGELTYDMWRAVRLVVDTGMHERRWSREKAIDYFMENAAKEELDVVNEIDRYIAWPGQALAYKIGGLKIRELRTKATEALGPRFDVREFHNVVLRDGPLPLDILERNVNEWVASKKG